MNIDASELTININEITISKKRLYDFFTVTLRPFMNYYSPPLFSVTQHHEKHRDPPTPYASLTHLT